MSSVSMPRPGLAFTAIVPNVRPTEPNEYEARLRRMSSGALIIEFESVAFDVYTGDATKTFNLIEARRELKRRIGA